MALKGYGLDYCNYKHTFKGENMVNFKTIEKKIRKNGWYLVRVTGSHYQYKHPTNPNTITVANHGSKDLGIFVISNLEKQTGLSLRR